MTVMFEYVGCERDRNTGAESITLKGNDKMDMKGAGCFGNPISHHEFLKEWGWMEKGGGRRCGRGCSARQIWMEEISMLPTHCTGYMTKK